MSNIIYKCALIIGVLFFSCSQMIGQAPAWVKPKASDFSYSATAICVVHVDDIRSNHANDRIAFFVGSQLRGLGTPVNIGGGVYVHFVTFYSNVAVEEMDIKIYHHSTDIVYDAINTITFEAQGQIGSIESPFIANGYTAYDAPISLTDIPSMIGLQETVFDTVALAEYLIQPDTNQVTWSFTPNANLSVVLSGSSLVVTPIQGYFGTTNLTVRATEVSVIQQYAEKTIIFQVIEAHVQPLLFGIFNQGTILGGSFVDFDLPDYENQYDGPCLAFDYEPGLVPYANGDTMPDWSISGFPQTNMTMTIQSRFTPKHIFSHPDDRLAIFIGGTLRAVSAPFYHEGNPLYFLTIGGAGTENEKIEVRFYSGILQKVFTKLTDFNYVPHNIIGTADDPLVFDFSPLEPIIGLDGNVEILIRDSLWTGEQKFTFKALDCTYSQYFNHQSDVAYCVVADSMELQPYYFDGDGDGSGNPTIVIYACSQPESGWSVDGSDCNDEDPLSQGLPIVPTITESSGIPNDGIVCSGADASISIDGPFTFLWENGQTTATIQVNPLVTTDYKVTVTSVGGCIDHTVITLVVEGTVVTSSYDSGRGTLRSVLGCIAEGGSVIYDQPLTNHTTLTSSLTIDKNVTIIGLGALLRPAIGFDFEMPTNGIFIVTNKILNLHHVDLRVLNNLELKSFFNGLGQVVISGSTRITE